MTVPLSVPEARDLKSMNPLEWCCAFGAATFYMWVPGLLDNISTLVALPPLYFMVYILTNSHMARSARRSEERDDIHNARELASQCISTLERLAIGMDLRDEYRVYIALGALSARVDLFLVRYRRYLNYSAKLAAIESANSIACAQLMGPNLVEPLARCKSLMEGVKNWIFDVDHPSLLAARS